MPSQNADAGFTRDDAVVALSCLNLSARRLEATPESVTKEALRLSSMLGDSSLPKRVLGAVRIRCVVKSITFEQQSQRFMVSFIPLNQPEKVEEIRSERVDGSHGALVRKLWSQSLVGNEAIIFKSNDPDPTGKVSQGFRVARWVMDLGD